MSYVFFTADTHLGHGNILKYAQRPELRPGDLDSSGQWVSMEVLQKRTHQMNERLIAKWNSRVAPGDTVYVLGDFCCKGKERGVDGERTKAQEWAARLNGTKVFILGNHDANNSLARGLDYGVMTAGGEKIFLCHNAEAELPLIPLGVTIIACGHVHTRWRERVYDRAVAVNVGVDVSKYAPVRLDELIGRAAKARKAARE